MAEQQQPPQPAWDYPRPFILPVAVESAHIDGINHVNNAVYVSWCQDAGWAHSQALGLNLKDYQRLDTAMAIRHGEYDYIAAAYLGEQLLVGTWLTRCDGRLNMERRFQILRESDGQVILRGCWTLVSIGISHGRPKRMPAEFKDVYCPAVVAASAAAV